MAGGRSASLRPVHTIGAETSLKEMPVRCVGYWVSFNFHRFGLAKFGALRALVGGAYDFS